MKPDIIIPEQPSKLVTIQCDCCKEFFETLHPQTKYCPHKKECKAPKKSYYKSVKKKVVTRAQIEEAHTLSGQWLRIKL